jgi:hypothetical protein
MPLVHARTRKQLLGQDRLSKGQREVFEVTITVPEDALPTHRGTSVYTQWWVQAGVDAPSARGFWHRIGLLAARLPWLRRLASDQLPWDLAVGSGLADRALLKVCRPAGAEPAHRAAGQQSSAACRIDLEVQRAWVAEGDEVQGSVTVTPKQEITAPQISVRLNRVETFRAGIGQEATRVSEAWVVLDDPQKQPDSSSERFAFALPVPSASQPYIVLPIGEAGHEIEAAVLAHGRRLAAARVPFFVYNCPDRA